jgi:hypothetical protein
MKIFNTLLVAILFLSTMLIQSCNAQKSSEQVIYSSCEPRPASPRLNIRASAENFGTIPPCQGQFTFYINRNSNVRSVTLELKYLNLDNKILSEEKIRTNLDLTHTGIFEKEVNLRSVKDVKCWDIQIAIERMNCFSQDVSQTECPEIRINAPDAFHSLLFTDESLEVCRNE